MYNDLSAVAIYDMNSCFREQGVGSLIAPRPHPCFHSAVLLDDHLLRLSSPPRLLYLSSALTLIRCCLRSVAGQHLPNLQVLSAILSHEDNRSWHTLLRINFAHISRLQLIFRKLRLLLYTLLIAFCKPNEPFQFVLILSALFPEVVHL